MRDPMYRRALAAAAAALLMAAAPAQQPKVEVRNSYVYRGQGRFDWTVYLAEDRATLDTIRCVEYTLHPTFPNPVRRICTQAGGFPLSTDGWGEFTILLKIEWNDGRVTRQQYRLDFHTPAKADRVKSAESPGPVRTGNTAKSVGRDQWLWTVYITADQKTLDQIRCVEYMLHPTFPQPIRDVCERGDRSDQAFPLTAQGWGTFDIGVKVQFRNGGTRYLKHTLRFQQ